MINIAHLKLWKSHYHPKPKLCLAIIFLTVLHICFLCLVIMIWVNFTLKSTKHVLGPSQIFKPLKMFLCKYIACYVNTT